MEKIKVSLILLFAVWVNFSATAQKNYFEEAISSQRKSGDYYLAFIPLKKSFSSSEVYSYAQKNGFVVRNLETRYTKEFGSTKEVVSRFEFISAKEKAISDEIDAMASKEDCKKLLEKYPLDKPRIEKYYFGLISSNLKRNLEFFADFVELFPQSTYMPELNNSFCKVFEMASIKLNAADIKKMVVKIPSLMQGINPNADLTNEQEVKKFVTQLSANNSVLSPEALKYCKTVILNGLQIITLDISKEYEEREYRNSTEAERISDVSYFINRFPNSSLKPKAVEELQRLDDKRYKYAISCTNVRDACSDYLRELPNGLNAQKAKDRIKEIDAATERQAQQQIEAARLAEQAKRQASKAKIDALKNGVGRSVSWQEKISFKTNSAGGVGDFILGAFGGSALNYTSYIIKYTAVVEAVIGENLKVIVSNAEILTPSEGVSYNYMKYIEYPKEEMNKSFGRTYVKKFNDVDLE